MSLIEILTGTGNKPHIYRQWIFRPTGDKAAYVQANKSVTRPPAPAPKEQ
jgi:hypothetical protein